MTETVIPLTPEALAADDVRQGFVTDYQAEVIAYYRRFIQGKNSEIDRLRARLTEVLREKQQSPKQVSESRVVHRDR